MNEDNGLDMKDVTVKEIGCGGLSERYQNDSQASGLDVVPLNKIDNREARVFFYFLKMNGEEKKD